MNQFIERIFELPLRQRIFLFGGAVVFIFALYGYFIYLPRATDISERSDQRDALLHDRDRKKALVANIEHTRQVVTQLDGDLRKAIAQLPDTKEIPDLLTNISSLGRESGLEIIQFKQRPEEYEDFYASVPVDVLVRGAYNQVEAFFDKVAHMARIVNVTNVAIKIPTKTEGDAITLDTSCAAVTFRFLDEAERERIAKQKEKEKGGAKP